MAARNSWPGRPSSRASAEDYDPSTDRLAAYGIGGLIAGKVLGKVGLFAKLAKFGKFIVVGVVAGFVFLKKKLSGK